MPSPVTLLVQCIVPDYRLPMFAELRRRHGEAFAVACGEVGFGAGLRTAVGAHRLAGPLTNRFAPAQALLWQQGVWAATRAPRLVIAEFSLRTVSTWVLLARRRRAGLATVLWGHAGGRRRSMDFLKRWMIRRCDGFITYTESQRRQLQEEFPHLPLWCAPNAVMWAAEYRHLPPPAGGTNRIIYVGRLVAEKKPRLLLEAFVRAARAGSLPAEAELLLVGDGPERAILEARTQEAGFAGRIRFAGHVAEIDRLRELYSPAVCSVSPGYVGLSATQSFGFGVPMVVADGEAHSPEIEACSEANARFFPADDEAALVQALAEVYTRRTDWLRRREAISQHARENYSLDRMADTFSQVIAHFTTGRSGAP